MPDYALGKIYRIYNPQIEDSMEYVGSTTQPFLSTRMALHRSHYRRKRDKMVGGELTAFKLFDEYGVGNCIIELVEKYPCNDCHDLALREGQIIRERNNTVNKNLAGRTSAEWHKQPHILAAKNEYTKARYATPEGRARQLAHNRAAYATPEGRAKSLAYSKARNARLKAEKDANNLVNV